MASAFLKATVVIGLTMAAATSACVAGTVASESAPVREQGSCAAIPAEGNVDAFLGDATLIFPNQPAAGAVAVVDRLLGAFDEFPGSKLKLASGDTIAWGFRFQGGTVQSVAIYDPRCELKMLAAVDEMPLLGAHSDAMAQTMQQYKKRLKEEVVAPNVTVFVRNARDLQQYLPILYRWLQADLLGFNVDCRTGGVAKTCKLAERIKIPLKAYRVPPPVDEEAPVALPIPDVQARQIPLRRFVQ